MQGYCVVLLVQVFLFFWLFSVNVCKCFLGRFQNMETVLYCAQLHSVEHMTWKTQVFVDKGDLFLIVDR